MQTVPCCGILCQQTVSRLPGTIPCAELSVRKRLNCHRKTLCHVSSRRVLAQVKGLPWHSKTCTWNQFHNSNGFKNKINFPAKVLNLSCTVIHQCKLSCHEFCNLPNIALDCEKAGTTQKFFETHRAQPDAILVPEIRDFFSFLLPLVTA